MPPKAPHVCCRFLLCAIPLQVVFFSRTVALMPPNSQWWGNDRTNGEREGGVSLIAPWTVFRVEYGHLIKTQKHCEARLRRSWGKERICGMRSAERAHLCQKQKLITERCKSEIKTHHFSTNGNEEEVSWVQKNLKKVPVGVSESWQEEWSRWRAAHALEP